MIINKSGIVIRIVVSDLRVMGRATQGVRLINLKANDEIASVARIDHEEDEEVEEVVNLDGEVPVNTVAVEGETETEEIEEAEEIEEEEEEGEDEDDQEDAAEEEEN